MGTKRRACVGRCHRREQAAKHSLIFGPAKKINVSIGNENVRVIMLTALILWLLGVYLDQSHRKTQVNQRVIITHPYIHTLQNNNSVCMIHTG